MFGGTGQAATARATTASHHRGEMSCADERHRRLRTAEPLADAIVSLSVIRGTVPSAQWIAEAIRGRDGGALRWRRRRCRSGLSPAAVAPSSGRPPSSKGQHESPEEKSKVRSSNLFSRMAAHRDLHFVGMFLTLLAQPCADDCGHPASGTAGSVFRSISAGH